MSLELIFLALAAFVAGIASGSIHELAGKRWAVLWTLSMAATLVALYVL